MRNKTQQLIPENCHLVSNFELPVYPYIYSSVYPSECRETDTAGNTEGGSITVQLTSCLTGLESDV